MRTDPAVAMQPLCRSYTAIPLPLRLRSQRCHRWQTRLAAGKHEEMTTTMLEVNREGKGAYQAILPGADSSAPQAAQLAA